MVRWRYCLVLALLMLLPTKIGSKLDEEDVDEHNEDSAEEEDDDDDDDDEELEKPVMKTHALRESPSMTTTREKREKRPLECFVCTYKKQTPLKSCLDPMKFRVHTITCHSLEDKCFTAVVPKGNTYESVLRGCRSGCVGTPDTTCCELNRCNSQAFALPEQAALHPSMLVAKKKKPRKRNSVAKPLPPTVLFFVSVLLLLQTVVKVAFV